MDKSLVRLSKFLSLVLRHPPSSAPRADGVQRKVSGVDVRVFTEYKPEKAAPKEKAGTPAASACSPSAKPIAANYLACTYRRGAKSTT